MTTEIPPPAGAVPPETEPKQGLFARIAGVLFAPAETFQGIVRRPDILAPLLLILAIGYASTILVLPKLDIAAIIDAQAAQMRKQNPQIEERQLEQVAKVTAAMAKVMGWLGPLLMVAWYAIVAGALLLVIRMFGGEGTYAQAFSTTLYAWVPMVLFSIISTIVILARGTFDPSTAATLVKSNPAFLVDMTEQPVLFSLLSSLDIFTIWLLVLLSIGFAAVGRVKKASAAAVVVSLWVLLVLIKVGFAAMGASQMKG